MHFIDVEESCTYYYWSSGYVHSSAKFCPIRLINDPHFRVGYNQKRAKGERVFLRATDVPLIAAGNLKSARDLCDVS